ncbi:MAG: hypothetical protein IMZ54_07725 [Acidobacteria bacterium]|nr:hypothetical protein [Acidobacteriota bacterium]
MRKTHIAAISKWAAVICAFASAAILLAAPSPATAQFRDDFNGPALKLDPDGVKGWGFVTGEGRAVMDFRQGGAGFASITVDATRDRRNVWWAFILHRVSEGMDLALLKNPGYALRIEARVRSSHAPRRINLQLSTQKTTDFHSHLMEFDIPDTENWHTFSMTTRGFEAAPGDTVNAHMALMDWGLGQYRLDVDYFRVDIVKVAEAGPDKGEPVPYHPPVADPAGFAHALTAAQSGTIDIDNPDVNLGNWYLADAAGKTAVVTAGGTRYVILRWDFGALAGKRVLGSGLLELTTRSLERTSDDIPDFGQIRVVEIIAGDPRWDKKTVTFNSLCDGRPPDLVICPQMIIDWLVSEGDGAKTYLTISKPVLQRLIDGKTLGIAIRPLGAINAAFYGTEAAGASRGNAPVLLLNIRD